MTPLIAAALPSLIKFVPSLIGMFAGDKAESAVTDVLEIGKTALGLDKNSDVLAVIEADPEQARLFQEAVMKDKYRLEELYVEDKQSARDMYKSTDHTQADKISDNIIENNAKYAILIGLAQILILIWATSIPPEALVIIGNVSSWLIKGFLDERKEVTGFYFGSSLGSKLKDKGVK